MLSSKRTEVIGTVEVKTIHKNSKSERRAAVVHTDDGDTLVLRRLGRNSLRLDKDFEKLNGNRMKFIGKQAKQYFFAISWYNI